MIRYENENTLNDISLDLDIQYANRMAVRTYLAKDNHTKDNEAT